MSFFNALFGGSNPSLNTDIGATQGIAGFATGQGESNITAGGNFLKSILSGDSSKITQALSPIISAAKTSNAQTQKTNAMFGNRSGGTAASNAASSDKLHGDITNLVGSLTGGAASSLLGSGSSLLGQGASAYSENAQMSQQQLQNWQNSILGKGIAGAASAAETAGLGAAGGSLPGGPGAAAGAQGALAGWFNG